MREVVLGGADSGECVVDPASLLMDVGVQGRLPGGLREIADRSVQVKA